MSDMKKTPAPKTSFWASTTGQWIRGTLQGLALMALLLLAIGLVVVVYYFISN